MKSYTFEVLGGRDVANGKSRWPDHISIMMRRADAWDVVRNLLAQLSDGGSDIAVDFVGKINVEADE